MRGPHPCGSFTSAAPRSRSRRRSGAGVNQLAAGGPAIRQARLLSGRGHAASERKTAYNLTPTDLKSRPEVQVDHTEPQPIPGVKTLEPRQARFQRRLVLMVTVLPFLGFLAAAWTLWGTGLSVLDASIFVVGYCVTGLGVTVGFHRLFTHKSFEARPALSGALAIAGSMVSRDR